MSDRSKLLGDVSEYYERKLDEFGVSSKGVDWKDESSQELRFKLLHRALGFPESGSILDYGCGFGSLWGYLNKLGFNGTYHGFDISNEMIRAAKEQYNESGISWTSGHPPSEKFDYVLASGIFNVRLEYTDLDWDRYVKDTLEFFNESAMSTFSFNMLTSYSDPEYKREYLFYADPGYWFDFCKKSFSPHVNVFHDYPLYEFTISVTKEPYK